MTSTNQDKKLSTITSDIPKGTKEDFLEVALGKATPEVKSLLLDPSLLHHYKKALDKLITGEDKSKLLLFLICCTSYTEKVLGAIITGESSAGKSYLMNNVLKFFGNVEEFTRITAASPDRLERSFSNRILKVEELRGTERAQASLRVWISEGQLKLLTTARGEDGNIETQELVTNGVPCFITTTTTVRPDTELLNRLFLISIDETEPQTKRVLEYEALEFVHSDFEEKVKPPQELLDALQSLALSPFSNVKIPYAIQLAKSFPSKSVKARRDFKKLLYIISAVAFLYQYQRPKVYRQKVPQYTVALPVDFYMAWEIASEGMKETLLNVQRRSLKVLELFTDANVNLTTRQVATQTDLSQNRAREILNSLVDYGFLIKDTSQKEHSFYLKENINPNGTIDDFVSFSIDFSEKDFEKWVKDENFKTRYRVWTDSFVHPITGEELPVSYRRVLKNIESDQGEGTTEQIVPLDGTKRPIVPLDDLVSVHWVEEPLARHECGVCGYQRTTSWKAITNGNSRIWICEPCVQDFENQRKGLNG